MIYFVAIAIYLFILLCLGIWKSRQVKTQEDFAVAGRSLSPWVLVGTMLATWIGTGSILGNAGKAYEIGLAALFLPVGSILGIFFLTKIASKVRGLNSLTVPEIIGNRFGDAARILSVVALVLAYLVIVSYQFNAGGAVLETILVDASGNSMLSASQATVLAAIFIVLFTVLAGLISVVYTDVANGIIMTIALIIAFPILLSKAGGFTGMEQLFEQAGEPQKMGLKGTVTAIMWLNFCLPPFLLILGDANMYQRFSAASTKEGAKKATTVLIFAVLIIEVLILACAWVASSMIPDPENGKYLMIYAAKEFLPVGLGAIMMTTIVGIIISTADSYLLVPATTLIRDIYNKYINPNASEKRIVFVSRILILALGFIAYLVSRGFAASAGFFEKALYAYTIYGAAITPTLLAALFWEKAKPKAAVASITTGILVTLLWKEATFIQNLVGEKIYANVDEVLPAIICSVLVLVVGSLITKK